ncbi:hypothetical protein M5K25_000778 [Dendrobium thyrsiflorum]|uniref:Uncharacterized protein n=1 Tax=Dendrobium thyrsiflorum TaxID=117978 RepID=A0ABD0VWP2_DENTH
MFLQSPLPNLSNPSKNLLQNFPQNQSPIPKRLNPPQIKINPQQKNIPVLILRPRNPFPPPILRRLLLRRSAAGIVLVFIIFQQIESAGIDEGDVVEKGDVMEMDVFRRLARDLRRDPKPTVRGFVRHVDEGSLERLVLLRRPVRPIRRDVAGAGGDVLVAAVHVCVRRIMLGWCSAWTPHRAAI